MKATMTFSLMLGLLGSAACGGAQSDAVSKAKKPAVVKDAPTPEGYHSVTPGLIVDDIDAAIEFYGKAFGAEKLHALPGPDGKTMHAEIKLGDSIIMLGGPRGETLKSPKTLGGTPGSLNYAVADVDAAWKTAKAAGGKIVMPLDNQFWGDRWGLMVDPFGHQWGLSTSKVQFTEEQVKQAMELAFAADGKGKKAAKAKKEFLKLWKSAAPAESYKQAAYSDVTAAFNVKPGTDMFAFYAGAFGGQEKVKMLMPDGSLLHGEVKLGDSVLMLSDESPAYGTKSPATLGGTSMFLYVYVPRIDQLATMAKGKGAKQDGATRDMFWGDRVANFEDPSGHSWTFASHTKDVTPEEMQKAVQAMTKK